MLVRVLVDWLEHDRRRRKPGDVLEMDGAAAERLIAAGLVADTSAEPVEIETPVGEPEPPAKPRAGRRSA